MFYEVIIGGLVGVATYMYLHYLQKSKAARELATVSCRREVTAQFIGRKLFHGEMKKL